MRQDEIWDADAAGRYDTPGTGMFAPEVLEPTVERLAELAGGGRVLELAIGTGRVAVPLSRRGAPVTGIELSQPMIEQLRTKVDEETLPVVVGDMATSHRRALRHRAVGARAAQAAAGPAGHRVADRARLHRPGHGTEFTAESRSHVTVYRTPPR